MFLTKLDILNQSKTIKEDDIDGTQWDYISRDSDLYLYLIMWFEYKSRNKKVTYDNVFNYEKDFQNLTKDRFTFKKNNFGNTVGLIWSHGCGDDVFEELIDVPDSKIGSASRYFKNFVYKENIKLMIQLVKDYKS